jgi:phenylacetate-coenzyme A ligase PaaK-like adenylate-forming protein
MLPTIERWFYLAPSWLKNVMTSIYGLIERFRRYGPFYRKRYKSLTLLRESGPEAVLVYQGEQLRDLLAEAVEYSPWYRDAFKGCGVTAADLTTESLFDVLERLPLLEKSALKAHMPEITSENLARTAYATVSTSGTSGSPMQVVFDAEGRQATFAEWRRYHDWLGLPKKFCSVRLSGRIIIDPAAMEPPFWVYNWTDKQLFMSTYHLKNGYLGAYIAKLNAFQPELIDGYPSAVYVLAKYLLQEHVKLNFVPVAISVTAETLMEHHRQTIEKAFGCKVYNQYASSEGAPWIVECSYGHSHLWLDTGVFEFLNPQPLDDDTYMAELVVTSFRNFKTPLIRYRIGDYVQLFKCPPVCACGAPYPIIKGVIGRSDDILFTEDKGSVGRLDPAYKGVQGIRQSKIVQHDLGTLEVLLVPEDDFDDSQQILLLQNLRDRLGQSIEIKFTLLDSIPLGSAGKLRSVERRFSLPEQG